MSKLFDAYLSTLSHDIMLKINRDLPYSDDLWDWENVSLVGRDGGNFYRNYTARNKFYFWVEERKFVYEGYGADSMSAHCGNRTELLLVENYKMEPVSSADFINFIDSICPYLVRQFDHNFPHAVISAECGNFAFTDRMPEQNPGIQTHYSCEITVLRKKLLKDTN